MKRPAPQDLQVARIRVRWGIPEHQARLIAALHFGEARNV